MEKKNDLKRELDRIAAKYSNTKCLALTKTYSFSEVPNNINNLWYSGTSLSVVSLKYCETLTQQDLDSLEKQFHNEFEKLRKCTYCN